MKRKKTALASWVGWVATVMWDVEHIQRRQCWGTVSVTLVCFRAACCLLCTWGLPKDAALLGGQRGKWRCRVFLDPAPSDLATGIQGVESDVHTLRTSVSFTRVGVGMDPRGEAAPGTGLRSSALGLTYLQSSWLDQEFSTLDGLTYVS